MSRPRGEVLFYTDVSLDEGRDFSRAPAWQGEVGGFDCRLDSGRMEARPQGHYPNTVRAREALKPHLRAWELSSELENGIRIQFKYAGAPGELAGAGTTVSAGAANLGGDWYPPPSSKPLATSRLVEDLLEQVRELRQGRPMLIPAGLFLTRLEAEYGGRDQAAAALNVSSPVLDRLGRLSARNDPLHRRKVKGPPQPLTEAERRWIMAVLPRLTRHVAEKADSNPPQLNMGDPELPPL
jgi:hypothetical protein